MGRPLLYEMQLEKMHYNACICRICVSRALSHLQLVFVASAALLRRICNMHCRICSMYLSHLQHSFAASVICNVASAACLVASAAYIVASATLICRISSMRPAACICRIFSMHCRICTTHLPHLQHIICRICTSHAIY
jgi:hypothetical protein